MAVYTEPYLMWVENLKNLASQKRMHYYVVDDFDYSKSISNVVDSTNRGLIASKKEEIIKPYNINSGDPIKCLMNHSNDSFNNSCVIKNSIYAVGHHEPQLRMSYVDGQYIEEYYLEVLGDANHRTKWYPMRCFEKYTAENCTFKKYDLLQCVTTDNRVDFLEVGIIYQASRDSYYNGDPYYPAENIRIIQDEFFRFDTSLHVRYFSKVESLVEEEEKNYSILQ